MRPVSGTASGSGAVVCGVDGSRVAPEALRTAHRLARALALRLAEARTVQAPFSDADDLANCPVLVIPAQALSWGWADS